MDRRQAHTVVITGASAGVGRATARAFALLGCRVALIARGSEGLEGARRDVEAAGGIPLVLTLDVADAQQVMAAADRIVSKWGKIHVWINCAMATWQHRTDVEHGLFLESFPVKVTIPVDPFEAVLAV